MNESLTLTLSRDDAWVLLCALELFLTVWSSRDVSAPTVLRLRDGLVADLAPPDTEAADVLAAVRADLRTLAARVPSRLLEELP